LQCIKTPGHTQDHCVYFCPELDGLFSGDLLQARFGHPMTQMLFGDLRSYLKSLQTVAHLGPKLLFPGHGEFSWQCHLDIQKTRELAAKMIETVHQMIIQQEATVTKDIIQKFAQKHKITDPTDVFVLKGSIRMVLEYLKDKIVQTNQINDPYKTTMDVNKKGPGGLTMEQIFARVQESRRLD
ncbi:beta-lactamase-like protein, partial [Gorgonomyces haynaldii]